MGATVATRPDSTLRSASDNGRYPELCMQAATDDAVFATFRRHPVYCEILEHVTPAYGNFYFNWLNQRGAFTMPEIIDAIRALNGPGDPVLTEFPLLGACSPTALRYAKVTVELLLLFKGQRFDRIAEIGAGFGGQMLMLDRLVKPIRYDIFDLPQANQIINRFVATHAPNVDYRTHDIALFDEAEPVFDLVISNYAFSELPLALQIPYIKKVIARSRHGYMAMNSGVEGYITFTDADGAVHRVRNLAQHELLAMLPGARVIADEPNSHADMYIIYW
jgi:hypothetical protein